MMQWKGNKQTDLYFYALSYQSRTGMFSQFSFSEEKTSSDTRTWSKDASREQNEAIYKTLGVSGITTLLPQYKILGVLGITIDDTICCETE